MSDRSSPTFYVLAQFAGKNDIARIDVSSRVLSFEFEDSEKKTDLLKLTLDNWDLSIFDDPIWRPGNILTTSWGYEGNMAPPRESVIQKIRGGTTISIEAQAKTVLMNKVVQSKTYENTSRSEIVHAIAKDYGYGDAVRDIEETPEIFPVITQARLTDAQFIKRLADAEGFEFFIDFDGFHWHRRRTGQKPIRVLQWYLPPDVGDIISFSVENDIFAKPGKVTVKGRDPLEKKDVTGVGSDATTSQTVLGQVKEILDRLGAGDADKSAEPRKDEVVGRVTEKVGVAEVVNGQTGELSFESTRASEDTRPTSETSAKQAKREADGIYSRVQQSAVEMSISMIGDPQLIAKSIVELRGLGQRLSGKYYVKQVNHVINSGGYQLSLKVASDRTNKPSALIAGAVSSNSKATLNQKKADEKPKDGDKSIALVPEEVIHHSTGESTGIQWKQPGREKGK